MPQTRQSDPLRDLAGFRRDLRVLEREVVRQLEGQTTCCGVTLAQCHTLLELQQGERSLNGLAEAMELDASTLCRTVESLVRGGLVERRPDPAARRAVRLSRTPLGKERVETIDAMCNRYYGDLLGQLTERRRREVLRAVRVMGELMRGRPAVPCACGKEKANV